MNVTAEAAGGSTCKRQENGDPCNESERPLKKARFAWQVKGKYHLKNDIKDTAKTSTVTAANPDIAGFSGNATNIDNNGSEQNLGMLGDYLLKQDFNSIDSMHTPPDQSELMPKSSISNENLPYPTYVSSYEKKKLSRSKKDMNNIPTSMVIPQNSEEQCIARWQAKQMVKGFVDNSINHVIDLWIREPLPPENEPSRFIALDVADFINNLPGDNSVENEGILMAISAHGLQHSGSSSSSNVIDDHHVNNKTNDSDNFHQLTPLPSDDESYETDNNICSNISSSNLDRAWSYSHSQKTESDSMTAFPLFPDHTSLSYQEISDSPQNSGTECDSIQDPGTNDCDFLDAAILFAIQSKGLTTSGSDYG